MEQELEIAPAVSLQEYLAILRRRRAILVQSFVLISVVGLVVTLMTKPVYHASARLLVDGPSYNLNTVDTTNPLSSLFVLGQQQQVSTQVEVLQAQPLLDKVAAQTGPASLTVAAVRDTNVIQVDSEANDPKVAAAAANALLDDYVSDDADQSLNEIKNAQAFVEKGGKDAQTKLAAAEQAVRLFQQQHHVTELTKDRDDQLAQVTALTTSYQTAQTALAALRAQIAQNRALLAGEPATVSTTLAATNANIANLRDQISRLEVQRQGLMQPGGYTDKSPQIQALDGQLRALRGQLGRQPTLTTTQTSSPNAVRDGLHSEIIHLQAQEAAQQTQVATLAAALAQAKAQIGHFADWEVTLSRLQRAKDDAMAADKRFNDEREDLSLREQARHAPARIIERAEAPGAPIRPKKAQSLLLACVIGLCVGICLALMQEFLDDRINTAEDADRVLGLPSLGLVPALSADDARLLPKMQGLDPAAESYRILRTNIHFAAIDTPLRTLMVTSSSPGEGKTTTATNLAYAMAIDGKRVILVDTDLRRPAVHKLLELPATPGVTDVLLGHATLDDALLQNEEMPNLSALTAGSTPPNPAELLGSRTFRNLVEQLAQRADIVIFDSPPVLAAADAQILAAQLDGVVLVVETGETRKAAARQTLKMLRQARANLLGVAYNKMKASSGGYYYYYQYQYGTPQMEAKNGHKALPVGTGGEDK